MEESKKLKKSGIYVILAFNLLFTYIYWCYFPFFFHPVVSFPLSFLTAKKIKEVIFFFFSYVFLSIRWFLGFRTDSSAPSLSLYVTKDTSSSSSYTFLHFYSTTFFALSDKQPESLRPPPPSRFMHARSPIGPIYFPAYSLRASKGHDQVNFLR